MHEAGADAATELAFTIADGLEYVRVAREASLDLDAVCSRLSFFFASSSRRLSSTLVQLLSEAALSARSP